MYKGNELIGKPIITFDTGEQIEKVKDVFFNAEENRLLALVVDEGGIFAKTRVLPFSSIKVIGPDAITVESASAIVEADSHTDVSRNIHTDNIAKGTKVMTEGGENLGSIKDIYFDEKTGHITGYEVTGGLLADAYEGKSFLPSEKILKMGKEVVFVPNDVVQLMESQVGGMRGATQKASQKAGSSMKESVAGFPSQETKEKIWDTSDKLQNNLQQGSEQFKQKASELWENVKAKTTELKGTATTKMEQSKIKEALGRPVSRVILNDNDEPILDTGELITHRAIQQARDAGVLDILLNSVSQESVSYNQAVKATSDGNDRKSTPPDPTDTTIIVEKSE